MEQDKDILWAECLKVLQDNLTPSVYNTWFRPLSVSSFDGTKLVLQVPSQFAMEYIEENYIDLLARSIFRIFGAGTRLEYKVLIDSSRGEGSTIRSVAAVSPTDSPVSQAGQAQENRPFESQLNPNYTFDTFIAGETNRLARAAGLSIAAEPGRNTFNPLFIFGGSGVGKTHLANAIGNQILRYNPRARVLYVSANTFKLQYMSAVKANTLTSFLAFYQNLDVLIMDDIQFLQGVKSTQDTFFHIFNHLQMLQRQLILTSDRSPVELRDIEDRLLSRFKWGLSAEIERPDFKLRRDILLDKMQRDGIHLPEDVISFIAHNVRDNIRDIEGILASLLAYSTLTSEEISLPLAEKVVGRIVSIQSDNVISVNDILYAVGHHYHVDPKAIISKSRTQEVANARHMAIYLCTQYTGTSLAEIGRYLGNRSHSTILRSAEITKQELNTNPVLRNSLQQIEAVIKR